MNENEPFPLLLASKSEARRRMLADMGFEFDCFDPAIDESAAKQSILGQGGQGAQVAESLAELKAQKASILHPGRLIIASDQVLQCGNVHFDKPVDMDHAKAQLIALAGKRHFLHASVCLVLDGQRLWHHNGKAEIELRSLSESQIDQYLKLVGESILNCVGCYRIEKEGALIFSQVVGDPYTIQGMPIIQLRQQLEALGFQPL